MKIRDVSLSAFAFSVIITSLSALPFFGKIYAVSAAFISIILLALASVLILREMQKEKTCIHNLIEMIQSGKLDIRSCSENADLLFLSGEFGDLIKKYKMTNSGFLRLSKAVIDTVIEMSDLSAKMLNANNAVSRGAETQAKESDACMITISKLSESFENVYNAVSVTETETQALSHLSDNGSRTVRETVQKSIKTKEAFSHVMNMVSSLKESANSVNQIVTAITDIADRTNLLSLNASIEAARAGDTGRGFAVVADEIRKLSEQSTAATKQIVDIVGTIRREIEEAVNLIESTSVIVDEQTSAVGEVGHSFDTIEGKVKKVSEQQTLVKDTMQSLQIMKNRLIEMIEKIAEISQESAAVSQEATSMNIQLSQSTEMIHDLAEKLESSANKSDDSVKKFEKVAITLKREKLALVTVTPHDNQFNRIMVENARKTAEKYDFDFFVTSPEHQKAEEQISIVEKIAAEGLTYLIIVSAAKESLTPVINRLYEKGIITVCIDSDAPDSKRLCYIGTDNLSAGKNMGKLIAKYLSSKGRVILSSPNEIWENMKLRLQGIRETLSEYPEIKIIASQTGYVDPDERCADILRVTKENPDFDMIAGINTGFTKAIEKVRLKTNLTGKKIIGFDNVPENLDAIKNGTLDAVLAQRQDLFTEQAIKSFYDYSAGRDIKKIQMLDTFEINKSNYKVMLR